MSHFVHFFGHLLAVEWITLHLWLLCELPGSSPLVCWPATQQCQPVPRPPPAHAGSFGTWQGWHWIVPPVNRIAFERTRKFDICWLLLLLLLKAATGFASLMQKQKVLLFMTHLYRDRASWKLAYIHNCAYNPPLHCLSLDSPWQSKMPQWQQRDQNSGGSDSVLFL